MSKETKQMLMILKGIDARLTRLEERDEKTTGGDGRTRVQPVPVVRAANKTTVRKEQGRARREDRGDNRRQLKRDPQSEGESSQVDVEIRRKAEARALDEGVHAAVSSFSPPDAPSGPPSRSAEVKLIWDIDDIIPCQKCKEPVYLVKKRLTTTSKLTELPDALEPYSEDVPKLSPTTSVKNVGGVWFNCPRCKGEWSVCVA